MIDRQFQRVSFILFNLFAFLWFLENKTFMMCSLHRFLIEILGGGMGSDELKHINQVYQTATCLFSKENVDQAAITMGDRLTERLQDKNPLMLCVVVGGMIPMGLILPHLTFPLQVDYLHVTRYRGKTAGQSLQWLVYPESQLKDRHVVIVDDILDGGVTMDGVIQYCEKEQAASVTSVVLLDKTEARLPEGTKHADIVGLSVSGNPYVFGCGMDYHGYFRNVPGIYALDEQFLD